MKNCGTAMDATASFFRINLFYCVRKIAQKLAFLPSVGKIGSIRRIILHVNESLYYSVDRLKSQNFIRIKTKRVTTDDIAKNCLVLSAFV
ncbi:MAG: hypothetical protein DI631_02945 [Acinetobacter johnsonii]|nr:MAG: hypothetical protein DI631_02945 [Acinetobacter johnsonii]